jgi:hypothetical protein
MSETLAEAGADMHGLAETVKSADVILSRCTASG